MNPLLSSTGRDTSRLEPKPAVRALIVYEDRATGCQARDVYELMVRQFGDDCEFQHKFLHLDALAVPALRQLASEEAVEADMIIFACHGNHSLSESVKLWCEDWLATGHKTDAALVGLFDDTSEDDASDKRIYDYMGSVARKGRMTFIPHTIHHKSTTENRYDEPVDWMWTRQYEEPCHREKAWQHSGINE